MADTDSRYRIRHIKIIVTTEAFGEETVFDRDVENVHTSESRELAQLFPHGSSKSTDVIPTGPHEFAFGCIDIKNRQQYEDRLAEGYWEIIPMKEARPKP